MSATSQKDRHYALLAKRIEVLSSQLAYTSTLMEEMQRDLKGIKTFSGLHAAQFMAISRLLDAEEQKTQEPKSSV